MSTYNKETGNIDLTDEDKEELRNGLGKNWAKNITNTIIWGNKKDPYEKHHGNI